MTKYDKYREDKAKKMKSKNNRNMMLKLSDESVKIMMKQDKQKKNNK